MKLARINHIEEYILNNKTVSLDKLCEVFNVSMNTIRRDISTLIEKGSIKKIYGGVTVNEINTVVPFEERYIEHSSEKDMICKLASKFIHDGDVIFIDSGTTTMKILDYIKDYQNLTILTNNLNIITASYSYPNLNVITLGGNLIRETSSFSGIGSADLLKYYNISKAFMASAGISSSYMVTNSTFQEYDIKKAIIEKAEESYVLVDSSKFGKSALVTYCELKDVDYLITNNMPSDSFVQYCNINKVNLFYNELDCK
jgi:DeoR family transcriptional regulator, myo-inositol catabolism operon repressor